MDFDKCPSCGHKKHVGSDCQEYVFIEDKRGEQIPARACPCSESESRKNMKGKKSGFYLIPTRAMERLAAIYAYGARKYKAHSWREIPPDSETGQTPWEKYYDALMRHLNAYRQGERCDAESGHHHLAHALWNSVALLELALDKEEEEP